MSIDLSKIKFIPKVYIVESPSYDDYISERSEGVILCKSLKMMGINSVYFPVFTMEGFKFALNKIKILPEDMPDEGEVKLPVLHISAHGNRDCFALTNDETVNWKMFREILIPVNESCFQLLTVSMSVCRGYNAIKATHTTDNDTLPYLYIIGPTNNTPWVEAMLAFQVFYYNFSHLFDEDLKALKTKLDAVAPQSDFQIVDGEEAKEKYIKLMEKIKGVFEKYKSC